MSTRWSYGTQWIKILERSGRKCGVCIDTHSPKASPFKLAQRFGVIFWAVPSLASIFQHMFMQESTSTSIAAESTRAGFLHEGLLIQEAQ